MEVLFVLLLVVLMASALASGFPVAFSLPGAAILTIAIAAGLGYLIEGSVAAYFFQGGPVGWLNAGVTNFRGIYWEPERDTLIAIPLFVFMGIMLERSKIAEDLLLTMAQLFGPIPGGLGISVVVVGALLAATTGIVGATVVAMGLISLPVMLRNSYSPSLATGTIAASGTLGQIIPPSIVLIILADQLSNATDQALSLRKEEFKFATGSVSLPSEFSVTSTSAGEMFMGAFVPGLVLVGIYALYILVNALLRPRSAPPVPYEGKYDRRFAGRVLVVLVPPLALIVAVLGSIIAGVATVNQAGAIGATGAMIMAGYRLTMGRRGAAIPSALAVASITALIVLISTFDINVKSIQSQTDVLGIMLATVAVAGLVTAITWSGWRVFRIDKTLQHVMIETAKTTSLVFIILIGAAMLTAAFRAFGGEELVKEFLAGLPGGFVAKFVLVMAVIFVLGFFLDFIEIAVVVVPIISPILLADTSANITAVWLGVMIGLNIQTSFLTPPFGFALFYLRGVAPASVRTLDMYRGVVPFILLQLTALGVVGFYPSLVNYLPERIRLTSETAPPPQNPRLQHCIEERNFVIYEERGREIRAAIDKAAALDASYLPEDERRSLENAFDAARRVFELVAAVRAAAAAVEAYVPEYEPLHREVRREQTQIRLMEGTIDTLQRQLRTLSFEEEPPEATMRSLEERIASLREQIAEKEAQIPAGWEEARARFVELAEAETTARRQYRLTADEAYRAIAEIRSKIAAAGGLAAVQEDIEALPAAVAGANPEDAQEALNEVERTLRDVESTSEIRSALADARRALDPEDPDREESSEALGEALDLYATELRWRQRASDELAQGLEEYANAIRDPIGLRVQDRLTSEQAEEVASCLAEHRDISLHF